MVNSLTGGFSRRWLLTIPVPKHSAGSLLGCNTKARARDAWHQAVCISKTDRSQISQYVLHLGNRPVPVEPGRFYFTISVLYYSTATFTIHYCTIDYYAILPRPQPFASRKPTCAVQPLHLENPPWQVDPQSKPRKPTCAC